MRPPRPLPIPDPDRAVALALELMAVPGVSGKEGQIMALVRQKLLEAGVPEKLIRTDDAHRKSSLAGETGNLIVKLPGTRRGRRRLLMAHVDTVPICLGAQPVVRGARVVSADPATGVGADDRAGAAAILTALVELHRQRLTHPPVTFVWTVQEEVGLLGARHLALAALGRPQLAFNFDGGASEKVTLGATGAYRADVEIVGVPAHAGVRPQDGVSAVAIAGLALAELHTGGWHGRIVKGRRTGTANVGIVRAGEATNVVTPLALLRAEVRSHDPKFRRQVLEVYRQAFVKAAGQVKNAAGRAGSVRFDARLDYEAFRLSEEEPAVRAAQAAVAAAGGKPFCAVSDGGLDANWMAVHGVPTVTLGAGQDNVHTNSEALILDEFHRACRIALILATASE